MRKAIVDTNVILNTAITPGMILVPGSLIILKQKIPGFNNILTMANYSMSFGLNDDLNKIEEKDPERDEEKEQIKNDRDTSNSVFNAINHNNNSNIASFSERNFRENIQQIDTKSDVGGGTRGPFAEHDTGYLVEMFAISAVGGFVVLKIISSVI